MSHLLPFESLDYHSLHLPPEVLIDLPNPEDGWYSPESDPVMHDRILRLTRGIHIINEWWQKQNLNVNYPIADHAFYLVKALPELEAAVRELHKKTAPHQKVDERFLVFGNGATQIIHAALYAMVLAHSLKKNPIIHGAVRSSTLYVTEQLPSYLESNTLTQMAFKDLLKWVPYAEHFSVDPHDLLEFVVTPNNPDGQTLNNKTNAAYTIHDRVNHWSLFLNENDSAIRDETLENDLISIFSLSKFLSFSGSRVGYAFVKDPQLAHFMKYYIIIATHGLARDGHYHCLVALRYLLDKLGRLDEYSASIRSVMQRRWDMLREAVRRTSIVLLNKQGPNAWIKTPDPAADYLMKYYNIEATYGNEYGVSPQHARINLLAKTNEFDELIWRLKNFNPNPSKISHLLS